MMILIVVSLLAEAQPLIEFFQLYPTKDTNFQIWENEKIKLIISGVGKIAAKRATKYIFRTSSHKASAFLNMGICGHHNLPLGTIVLAHKITESKTFKTFYPPLLFTPPCPTKSFLCVDEIEKKYKEDFCYDMESFGFYETAISFVPSELIYSIKIISDNKKNTPSNLTKKRIYLLIEKNLSTIEKIIQQISLVLKKLINLTPTQIDLSSFKKWSFSATDKQNLEKILRNIQVLSNTKVNPESLKNLKKGKEVLQFLEKKKKKLILHLPCHDRDYIH